MKICQLGMLNNLYFITKVNWLIMLIRNVSLCVCAVFQKCDYSSIWCEMKNYQFEFSNISPYRSPVSMAKTNHTQL